MGSTQSGNIAAFVLTVDECDPNNPVFTALMCSTNSGSISIDRKLTSATVSGTLTCTDFDTGEAVCQLSKSETLQGVGDIRSVVDHSQFRENSFVFNEAFTGQSRDAQVVTASITGCGVNLTEQDAEFATLESANTASVQITHD